MPSFRLQFAGSSEASELMGQKQLTGVSHYFLGADPKGWRPFVRRYQEIQLKQAYPGIDVLFYSDPASLEFDFVVAPGADPSAIHLKFPDTERLHIDPQGNLVIPVGNNEIRLRKPHIYQDVESGRRDFSGQYVLADEKEVHFAPFPYDCRYPLVIDPVLSYSTYLAGSGGEIGQAIAVDSQGFIYVVGHTRSHQLAMSEPWWEARSSPDVFVAKLNPEGSELLFTAFLGGSSDENQLGGDIALDSLGNIYITGQTSSADFPVVHPLQTSFAGGDSDAYLAKLSPDGSQILYSTYIGGSGADIAFSLAVDSSRVAFLAGGTSSTDFPTEKAVQEHLRPGGYISADAFLCAVDAEESKMVFSTYLGGTGTDSAFGVAVQPGEGAFVVGGTMSDDFPTSAPFQRTFGGGAEFGVDGFITHFAADGRSLEYSSYVGGSGDDAGLDIAVDAAGNAYITGATTSADFPLVQAFQGGIKGGGAFGSDAFAAKVKSDGSGLEYSSYLGGPPSEFGKGDEIGISIALDQQGRAYIAGATSSDDFPTRKALQSAFGSTLDSRPDAFVTRLSESGQIDYSTYLGGEDEDWGYGIAVGPSGDAFVTGGTTSEAFPVVHALDSAFKGGGHDAFVARLGEEKEIFFAQFGDGGSEDSSISSQICLYNLSPDQTAHGTVDITDDEGKALVVDLNGVNREEPFQIAVPPNGLTTLKTDGKGPLRTGSVRVVTDGDLAGVILFQGVGTAGVQASQRSRKIVAPVLTDANLNSGVALMGLGTAQTVHLELRDKSGALISQGTQILPATGHIAKFVTEITWDPEPTLNDFTGTLTVHGSADFAATAILVGPDGFATLPVRASEEPKIFTFAQFGDGATPGGDHVASNIILFNLSTENQSTADLSIKDDAGSAMEVDLNDTMAQGYLTVVIPPGAIETFETDGEGELKTGSVEVFSSPEGTGGRLAGVILYRGFGLAGVPASESLRSFRAPVLSTDGISQGVALRGSWFEQVVNLELRNEAGVLVSTAKVPLGRNAHVAKLLSELNWDPMPDLSHSSGTITGHGTADLSATLILVTENEYATLPVIRLP